jgi:hypothetical protein
MSIEKTPEQDNVVDGAPLIIQEEEGGAYVTVADRNLNPIILALDMDDLKSFADIYLRHPECPDAA